MTDKNRSTKRIREVKDMLEEIAEVAYTANDKLRTAINNLPKDAPTPPSKSTYDEYEAGRKWVEHNCHDNCPVFCPHIVSTAVNLAQQFSGLNRMTHDKHTISHEMVNRLIRGLHEFASVIEVRWYG